MKSEIRIGGDVCGQVAHRIDNHGAVQIILVLCPRYVAQLRRRDFIVRALVLIFIALGVAHAAHAQVYKCNEGGRLVYSGQPCVGGGGAKIDARPAAGNATAAVSTPQQTLQKLQTDRRLSEIDREIRNIEYELDNDQRKMDRELDALRNRKAYANNNLAGATWQASISQEMQAVTQKYQVRNQTNQERLTALRNERQRLAE